MRFLMAVATIPGSREGICINESATDGLYIGRQERLAASETIAVVLSCPAGVCVALTLYFLSLYG